MPGRICRRMRHLFSAFLQNELTPYHRRQVEEHLAGCEGCQEEIHLLQLSLSSLQYLERVPVPSGFRASVRRQIVGQIQTAGRCAKRSWLKGLVGATIGIFILGLGISGWWWNIGRSWNRSLKSSFRTITQPADPLTARKDISSSQWTSRKISSNPLNIGERESHQKAQASSLSHSMFTKSLSEPPFGGVGGESFRRSYLGKDSRPTNFRIGSKTRPLRTQSSPQQVPPAGYSNRIPPPAEPDSNKPTVYKSIDPLEAMLRHAAQVRKNSRALALPQESISFDRPRGIPQTEPSKEAKSASEGEAFPEADQEIEKAVDELPAAETE